MGLNGFSGFGLGVFIVTVFLVVFPVSIPLPRIVQTPLERIAWHLRLLDSSESKRPQWHAHFSLETAPVIAVLLLLATTAINGTVIRDGLAGEGHARNYDVLVLFICLAYIAVALDGTGALRSLAFLIAKKGGASGPRQFFLLFWFFFGFGVIFGNDPIVLSGTAFLAYFVRITGIDPPLAFLFSQFAAANVASAVLVTSNPTNVLIAGGFDLNFITGFTKFTILPSVIAALVGCPLIFFMFKLRVPSSVPSKLVLPDVDPRSALIDPEGALFHATLMITTLATLVGSSFIPNDMVKVWQVTLAGGGIGLAHDLVIDYKRGPTSPFVGKVALEMKEMPEENKPEEASKYSLPPSSASRSRITLPYLVRRFCTRFPTTSTTIKKLPLPLLPFAASMFILVRSLSHLGWIDLFAKWLAAICTTPARAVFFTGYLTSIILCPMFGTNIGATILVVQILQNPHFASSPEVLEDPNILRGAIYAVALGSNIGALSLAFAASLAGLLWREILRQKGIIITATQFALWNAIPVVLLTTISLSVVYGQLYWF